MSTRGRSVAWRLMAWVAVASCAPGCGAGRSVVGRADATVDGRVDVPWGASDAGEDGGVADAADVSVRFPCPEGWVAYGPGGCGPAVLLCGPDGGAAPGACDGENDPTTPVTVRDPDGVEGTRFYRLPDGGIGGGWSTPWECPTGWTNAPEGYCKPTLRDDCPLGSGPLPDGTCTPTDESHCPASEYAEVPPEAAGQRVVYVRAGATGTPDGSMGAPYVDLQQAVAAEPAAEWFLVGAGRYSVSVAVRHAMHVIGSCAARVVFTGTPDSTLFLLDVAASRLQLRGVTLQEASRGVHGYGGSRASIERSVLSRMAVDAIFFNEASTVDVSDSLLGDDARDGTRDSLIQVSDGSSLTLRRSSLRRGAPRGVYLVRSGANGIIENVALQGSSGFTLEVRNHARLTVQGVAIRGATNAALDVAQDSRAEVTDLSVRDLRVSSDGGAGCAVNVRSGASMTGRRIAIDRTPVIGRN